MAVTSNLNIHFLRPCVGEGIQAVGTLLRMGKRSAVVRVDVRAQGSNKQSSEVTVTYALPE
jgi:acyl-coenzyme A thioesterase PaaI-like protein